MINRRGFLTATLAAGVAPAFVKAENLMGLYVPKPIAIPEFIVGKSYTISHGDYIFNSMLVESVEWPDKNTMHVSFACPFGNKVNSMIITKT